LNKDWKRKNDFFRTMMMTGSYRSDRKWFRGAWVAGYTESLSWALESTRTKIGAIHCTVKPVLAVTSIKQPTCLKQPYNMFTKIGAILCTVKPVLAVTSIKQPTCLKQPYNMFPNFNFVLIFTSIKKAPALRGHFCASLGWLLKTSLTTLFLGSCL